MTLILSLANRNQVIQVSDRRFTAGSHLVDDEANKAAALIFSNSRFVFGFTGLAKAQGFDTRRWLYDALLKCSPPECTPHHTFERLKELATDEFQKLPPLKRLSRRDKRLSVMFTGYLYTNNPPLVGNAILTNFQDFDSGKDDSEAWNKFKVGYWTEIRPSDEKMTFVQRIGAYQAMKESDEMVIRKMLEELKPARAIVQKAFKLIREMSDRPRSRGTIGKQLSAIILYRDQRQLVETAYYSNVVNYNSYMPDYIFAASEKENYILSSIKIGRGGPDGPKVMSVPKVRKNSPCPCGSGDIYKLCHGS